MRKGDQTPGFWHQGYWANPKLALAIHNCLTEGNRGVIQAVSASCEHEGHYRSGKKQASPSNSTFFGHHAADSQANKPACKIASSKKPNPL